MDQRINTESLRKILKSMKRKEVSALCEVASVSLSTVSKFRSGGTKELGGLKSDALAEALAASQPTKRRPMRAAAKA